MTDLLLSTCSLCRFSPSAGEICRDCQSNIVSGTTLSHDGPTAAIWIGERELIPAARRWMKGVEKRAQEAAKKAAEKIIQEALRPQ